MRSSDPVRSADPLPSQPAVTVPARATPTSGGRSEDRAGEQTVIRTRLPRRQRWTHGLDWPTTLWIAVLHAGAAAAPFVFSWKGLVALLVLFWLTGGIGICLGFHRLFSHHSFEVPRPLQWLLAWLGGLAGEGPIIRWVANHRLHHARSDREGDPHTPREGFWWSHVIWVFPRETLEESDALNRRWAPDLMRDPVLRFIDATFVPWHLVTAASLFLAGTLIWDLRTGLSLLVWGVFLRMVLVFHATWLINSATHMWGYRTFETDDRSRNLWWVALLTFGEGWHNNHHAYPRLARHGRRWWELDLTFGVIWLLERLRIARKVARPSRRRRSLPQES